MPNIDLVVSEPKINGAEVPAAAATTEVPPALLEKPAGLPVGNYKLVGWDIDTTGRRLIDEICQIAAYTPTSEYTQHIMPHGDLNPSARRRHNVRVFTVGRYRMLKDSRTHKVLKTKSEITALTEFLDWLEAQKGSADSVILIYHEPRRLSPTMLLESLTRYSLLERFSKLVSGFADGYALAADRCKASVKSVSLHMLSRVLLDADAPAAAGALERASAAYRVLDHLSQSDQAEAGAASEGAMAEAARQWARPVRTELDALAHLKQLLERQNTLRPVFAPLLRTARPERRRVTALRRLLADAGLLYPQLHDAWQHNKIQGLTEQLAALSTTAKEEDVKELLDILECHFDPEKEAKAAKPQPRYKKPAQPAVATDTASGTDGTSSDATPANGSPAKINNVTADTGTSEAPAVAAN